MLTNKPQKILIIGPSWVGDMVMSQSLYRELKHLHPDVIIDVLAPEWTHPILNCIPEVNRSVIMPVGHKQFQYKVRREISKSLAKENYDQAIVLPGSFKSALIPYWAHIAKRTAWRGEMRYGLLNDLRLLDKKKYQYMVQRYVALAHEKGNEAKPMAEIFQPNLHVNSDEAKQSVKKLELRKAFDSPVLILCPGAEYGPAKRWPSQYFSEIAQQKHADGWQICLFGSKKDQEVANEIQKGCNDICIDLTGKTSLEEAVHLMSLSNSVVSNDSGLMHVAAALNKPVVAIYGSSDPFYTPPLSKAVKILKEDFECSPCFKRECPLPGDQHMQCLLGIKPDKVLEAIEVFSSAA